MGWGGGFKMKNVPWGEGYGYFLEQVMAEMSLSKFKCHSQQFKDN